MDARQTALFVLNSLNKKQKTLDSILEEVLGEDCPLSDRDRGLAYALVYGVLRWRGRLDHIIGHFSKTSLKKIDPSILNILRMGVFQIIYMDRIPVSAAVNTAVEMAKFSSVQGQGASAPPWVVRFVNGVLRKSAREYETVPFPNMKKNLVSALAAKNAFPKWMIKKWLKHLGLEQTELLCKAINAIPPITVRTNTLRATREQLEESLEPDVGRIERTPYSRDGLSFFNPKRSISKMSAFEAGWFQVQDEAAQLVTLLLDPRPGETILDACAGLGGKTGHIAQQMENTGHILAMDKDENKLAQLRTEMDRLGFSIVDTHQHDLTKPFDKETKHLVFDRILLDAPCSGLGVLRRNPDAKWFVSKKDILRCAKRQTRFLHDLAPLVKPSGILMYAVCSTESEENEEVMMAFLDQHPEFRIKGIEIREQSSNFTFHCSVFKTSPHHHDMDGFFAVSFQRKDP